MITEETYLEMVKLVALYESGDTDDTDWKTNLIYTQLLLKLLVDTILVMEMI
jgi:hypothetical protein